MRAAPVLLCSGLSALATHGHRAHTAGGGEARVGRRQAEAGVARRGLPRDGRSAPTWRPVPGALQGLQNNGKWLKQACPSESQVRFVLHAALQSELPRKEIERQKAQISASATALATYAGMRRHPRILPPRPS